ncbi:MAG: T9SS type A sorting domain-containing protein [Bacteroidetes bacterium]|nr:T9SS type A sorting domain-containing protein [Bacteroidota bacterium]
MKKFLLTLLIFCSHLTKADFWTQMATFPGIGTVAPFSFVIGNLGYLGCGSNTKEFWEYDPVTNVWTQKANFGGIPRQYALGFSILNKGYAGTGRDGGVALSDFWEYDPSANVWTQKTDFPFLREGGISFSYGTKGYMGTGHDTPGNNITYADLWEYDPVNDTWTQKADFPLGPRVWAVGLTIDNKCYLACGCDGISVFYHDFWEYDPLTNVWTAKASFPGTDLYDAAAFSICGKGFMGTGETNAGNTNAFWQYDPVLDQWLQKTSLPGLPREETGFFSIGSKGYIGLGAGGGGIFDFWEYTPDNICSVVAGFTAPHHICPGTCTDFTNLSQNGTSYLWTFAGANPGTSTDANPTTICYNTPGNYSVSLIATNAGGSDTLTLNNYITVYPYPAPQGIAQSGDTLFANAGAISYQWYHGGILIPGATDYFYVATESGDYNIVATDANGCEVEAAIFDVIASLTPAFSEGEEVTVYPNPVIDFLTIVNTAYNSATKIDISIYNITGQNVLSVQSIVENQHADLKVDGSTLNPGIYFLQLRADEKIFRIKFIKK